MMEDDDILYRNRGRGLVNAVRNGRLDEVRMQLEMGADINYEDYDGDNDDWTALHAACKYGHKDIVVELLKHDNVDVNHQNKDGDTALLLASDCRFTEIKILLSNC